MKYLGLVWIVVAVGCTVEVPMEIEIPDGGLVTIEFNVPEGMGFGQGFKYEAETTTEMVVNADSGAQETLEYDSGIGEELIEDDAGAEEYLEEEELDEPDLSVASVTTKNKLSVETGSTIDVPEEVPVEEEIPVIDPDCVPVIRHCWKPDPDGGRLCAYDPEGVEICGNEVDDDCDGFFDEEDCSGFK